MTSPTSMILDGNQVPAASAAAARAQFLDRLYAELERRQWLRAVEKATFNEATGKAISQRGVTLHRPNTKGTAGADLGLKSGKLTGIYANSDNVVAPRSYAGDREEQALRWISTMTFKYLGEVLDRDPREVQAAVHGGRLHLAANTRKSNTALAELVGTGTAEDFTVKMLFDLLARAQGNFSSREARHYAKLRNRILSDGLDRDEYAAHYPLVSAAMSAAPVVCGDGEDGLHAERRIAARVRPAELEHIAGVKRPCVSCYLMLFEGKGVHPGPYWPADAANIGVAEYTDRAAAELAERITGAVQNTYVTLKFECDDYVMQMTARGMKRPLKKNSVDDDVNSDSDSDTEGEELVAEQRGATKRQKRK